MNVKLFLAGQHAVLGHGDNSLSGTPRLVEINEKIVSISMSGFQCAAVTEHGELFIWGANAPVRRSTRPTHTHGMLHYEDADHSYTNCFLLNYVHIYTKRLDNPLQSLCLCKRGLTFRLR